MTEFQFKVIVAGPFAAGKTTFINHISETAVVGTEAPTSHDEARVKATTTVGMEYGTFSVGGDDLRIELLLYGVPGQERFRFMWDIVGEGMDALLILIDATKPETWSAAAEVGRHLQAMGRSPTLVAVNRANEVADHRAVVERARREIALDEAGFVACDLLDRESARATLVELLELVLDRVEDEQAGDPIGVDAG